MAYKIKDKEGKLVKYQGNQVLGTDITNVMVKDVDLGNRTLLLIGTDETRDRDGDILTYSGWEFENFYKNPVFLWAHDYSSVPLARVTRIIKRPKQKRYDFLMKFPTPGINTFADMILTEYYEKIINASSVGFIGKKSEEIKDDQSEAFYSNRRFTEKELLELSGCPVPCNPTAVQETSFEKFLDQASFNGIKAKDILSEYKKGNIPNLKLDDLLEELNISELQIVSKSNKKIYVPDVDEGFKTFVIEDIEEKDQFVDDNKRVGGARNLPLADEAMGWDGPAAAQRVRRFASSDNSGDKDTVDFAKYRKAFAWYDTAAEDSFGSYKLPFADIVGGSMKAVWRGVAAGMAALLGARGGVNVPDSDRRPIYNLLAGYYEKFDKEPPEFKESDDDKKLDGDSTKLDGEKSGAIEKADTPESVKLMECSKEKLIEMIIEERNQKSGAVLNKKNLALLNEAIDNIQKVLDSAKRDEEEEDKLREPERDTDNKPEPEKANSNQSDDIYASLFKDAPPNKKTVQQQHKTDDTESIKQITQQLKELSKMLKSI